VLRLPSTITLPFGYRVRVKLLGDEEFNRLDQNADGLWDESTREIFIRKRLSAKRRAYILVHELGHAWLDFSHQYLDTGEVKP